MHPYLSKLHEAAKGHETLLCFGMDPVIERMRIDSSKNITDAIVGYFTNILSILKNKIAAVKPNVGYYLQYGLEGMRALLCLVNEVKRLDLPVIIDLKAGDIGRTSAAYARFVFDVLGGDAVTLNPYMGYDSLEPFLRYSDKGFYLLALTSNPGSRDFQFSALSSGKQFHEYILQKVCSWAKTHPSIGTVLGATQKGLKRCITQILEYDCIIPLLIPGVGAQGGSYGDTMVVLDELGYETANIRINASSSISFAHERFPNLGIEEAAFKAAEEIVQR